MILNMHFKFLINAGGVMLNKKANKGFLFLYRMFSADFTDKYM